MKPRRKIIPLFVPHLGCPNQCVFCDQRRISGSPFPASAETVRAALEPLRGGSGYEVAFYGGSFTAIPAAQQEALLAAVEPYRASGLVEAVRVSTRPDAVDGTALARLRRFGVGTVELGAQSMTDEVLRRSGRGHTAADTVRAAGLVRNAGFQLILQMMTGLPGETPESALATARALAALKPDGVRVYPTVILRGTALEAMWRRGEYREHTVEDAVEVCADILPVFEAAGIPVIRLGLNPTEELSGGEAVGGAYHPALGELARSRVLRRRAETLLAGVPAGSDVTLGVRAGELSRMTGQHRENIDRLREQFCLRSVKIMPCEAAAGEILLLNVAINGKRV